MIGRNPAMASLSQCTSVSKIMLKQREFCKLQFLTTSSIFNISAAAISHCCGTFDPLISFPDDKMLKLCLFPIPFFSMLHEIQTCLGKTIHKSYHFWWLGSYPA